METAPSTAALTAHDRAVLEFERITWNYLGAKEGEVRERFDMDPVAYFQRLTRLIELPAAEAYDPQTVRRLRRLRDERKGARRNGSAVLRSQ